MIFMTCGIAHDMILSTISSRRKVFDIPTPIPK